MVYRCLSTHWNGNSTATKKLQVGDDEARKKTEKENSLNWHLSIYMKKKQLYEMKSKKSRLWATDKNLYMYNRSFFQPNNAGKMDFLCFNWTELRFIGIWIGIGKITFVIVQITTQASDANSMLSVRLISLLEE